MELLGRYQVGEEIGRGSMGTVYRAHDPLLDRPVALKVARFAQLQDPDRERLYRRLFFNEMNAAARLHHPNIVEVYDAGHDGNNYYIAMEYVDTGRTLDRYSRGDRLLQVDAVAEIVFKCAEALDYAHRQGVVHRDIKPGNILLGRSGDVKLGDFSVALLMDPGVVDTQLLEPVGSPMYMAPEQLSEEAVTHQTDLFSLGVVLYELLTGRHPFQAHNVAALTHKIVNERPAPVSRYRADVPVTLERIVTQLLAKKPEERYPSALDLAADLSQCFSELKRTGGWLTSEARVDLLRSLAFFSSFRDAEIWELLRWAEWRDCAPGEPIVSEGELDHSVYILARGEVEVRKRGRPVARISAGESFGEMGYLARRRRSATIVALSRAAVLRLNARRIEQASMHCQVQFQKTFIESLVERLIDTTSRLAERDPV